MVVVIINEKKSKEKRPPLKFCLLIHERCFSKYLHSYELYWDSLKCTYRRFPPGSSFCRRCKPPEPLLLQDRTHTQVRTHGNKHIWSKHSISSPFWQSALSPLCFTCTGSGGRRNPILKTVCSSLPNCSDLLIVLWQSHFGGGRREEEERRWESRLPRWSIQNV